VNVDVRRFLQDPAVVRRDVRVQIAHPAALVDESVLIDPADPTLTGDADDLAGVVDGRSGAGGVRGQEHAEVFRCAAGVEERAARPVIYAAPDADDVSVVVQVPERACEREERERAVAVPAFDCFVMLWLV